MTSTLVVVAVIAKHSELVQMRSFCASRNIISDIVQNQWHPFAVLVLRPSCQGMYVLSLGMMGECPTDSKGTSSNNSAS